MHPAIRSFTRPVAVALALAAGASCTQVSSTAPAPTSLVSGDTRQGAVRSSSVDALEFPLLAGTFVIGNAQGDQIVGTYSGMAVVSAGAIQRSILTFRVLDGSGAFAGAEGTMESRGVGAFADEGEFVLEGRGEVQFPTGRHRSLVVNIRGSSRATCGDIERIGIIQTASGTMARAGRVTATLSHEVGSTTCGS